ADAGAGLLSRRVPAGVGSPDVSDIVNLAFIVGGYVLRQFKIRRFLRELRAGAVVVEHQDQEQTHGAY
ncbi:hypothetical protein, partial [Phyllobacterium calauticae]|uniref:hypothetical protein n=1 Tax=Phyllobacterium calauticae TaxID=2817027 RepID=UPI001CBBD0AB